MSELAENAIRTAMQCIRSSDIPAEHKSVVLKVLGDALRQGHYAVAAPVIGRPWEQAEETDVCAYLQGRTPNSWQQADEIVMALATRLHRTPQEVRLKAVELGLEASVDYAIARRAALQS